MSFRTRLALFFLLIVVLPMVAVAVLVVEVAGDSQTGKADARLSAGLETALSLYREDQDQAARVADGVARDPRLGAALRESGADAIETAARRIASDRALAALTVSRGNEEVTVGSRVPLASAEVSIEGPEGTLGSVLVATETAPGFAEEVKRLTGEEVAVQPQGEVAASTVDLGTASLPPSGESADLEVAGGERRAASIELEDATGPMVLALLTSTEEGGFAAPGPVVVVVLVVFFAVAFLFIVLLVRALQGQVSNMLDAARRIGGGDFTRQVPAEGNDEMAGLAREFNKMSTRLSSQMGELRQQRVELERSVRRIGEAFASGLDRRALLEIVVETTISACDAQYGRIALGTLTRTEAEAGAAPKGSLREAIKAAEARALRDGEASEARREDSHAVAHPLVGLADGTPLGAMAIARTGAPFDPGERELLRYLVGQASISIENVGLHELVTEQAVTDALTGLANNRRFRELIDKEAARAERFGHELSLLVLDIDDFKAVNDTYGHQQGDEVLRAIAGILRRESRGVDEPARYGGEEFVIVLPETGLEGAHEVAERIRSRIEETEIPLIGGGGAVRVTASIGAASLAESPDGVRALISAADQAMYQAKREGKNRAETANGPSAAGRAGKRAPRPRQARARSASGGAGTGRKAPKITP